MKTALLYLLMPACLLHAQFIPQTIRYQGHVRSEGTPFSGDGFFRFALISPDGATTYWSNDGTSVAGAEPTSAVTLPVDQGRYAALLGDSNLANMQAIPPAVANQASALALRVWFNDGVNGSERMEPDVNIGSVPYAMLAHTAATVDGSAIVEGSINGGHLAEGILHPRHFNAPSAPLAGQVLGYNGTGLAWSTPTGGAGGGGGAFSLNGNRAYYSNGPVGIGTSFPDNGLEIASNWDSNWSANLTLSGDRPTILWEAPGSGPGELGKTYYWISHMANRDLIFYQRRTEQTIPAVDTGWQERIRFSSSGDISYSGFQNKLDTYEHWLATIRASGLLFGHSARRGTAGLALVDWYDPNINYRALVLNWDNAWPETIIGGNVTQVTTLRITGGADLAEPFAMSDADVPPGSVVVIDETRPGKLRVSREAYDRKVAGIVSGADGIAPGISMTHESQLEGGQNVALSGRVYARANNLGGPIQPGDLLTTSAVPGEAMRVNNHDQAQGAILGKAMSSLDGGSGKVLVLVTLQ